MHTILDVITPNGDPLVYRLMKVEGKKQTQIASVLVVVYESMDGSRYIEVLHIFVDKKYRRKGLGKLLVGALQKSFDLIITGWDDSTPPGRELFLSMGFGIKKALKNNVNSTLEWVR